MAREQAKDSQPSLLGRIHRSIWREPGSHDERWRIRHVMDDLILHLHPARVSTASLRLTYTFGLGGLSVLLLLILIATGVLLMFVYTPTPQEAFSSIEKIATEIWMGQFIRNLHHWSGNLLLILVVLHMLRVFYTAAFHTPRQFNWILGLCSLALVALSNFTGYLMPWDQLSYWATTIVTSMLGYVPVVGEGLKNWLLGGPEIGSVTLRTFFALHVVIIPLLMAIMLSYHFWRVRKDTFTVPRRLIDSHLSRPQIERVTTIPHLINVEVGVGLVIVALLFVWATAVNAPLGNAANPLHPPNPAKAAWYFMGFQELLLHFHPFVVTVVFPVLVIGALLLLPYVDMDDRAEPDTVGVWFRSQRGRRMVVFNGFSGVVITAVLVVIDDLRLHLTAGLPAWPLVISSGLVPLGILLCLALYWRFLAARGATRSERNLALFTLLLSTLITLTVIGIFFRGQNMALAFPWSA